MSNPHLLEVLQAIHARACNQPVATIYIIDDLWQARLRVQPTPAAIPPAGQRDKARERLAAQVRTRLNRAALNGLATRTGDGRGHYGYRWQLTPACLKMFKGEEVAA
ncbi:hypothetical protein [Pannonibacter indicus]|uniref:hypothetical protein n=1 Tax=Pannonibacter indicus TaxID=466044 RepID=UPI00391C22AF